MREFLTIKQAALYCSYNAAYFGRIMEQYKIPKYGPNKNRIRVLDLEAWMKNPEVFTNIESETRSGFRRIV
ncbi:MULTISPECIES: hypothetical protein [Desulfovibrio]|uniref:Uncharacterized protein n=1 Tax=Desulfovibrio desulfuricans TaxID=876 RepID=A0AA94HVK3_DESDE|nr:MULTISPECIES: hypothetical protein [Desulfovibrio]SFW75984.1 hypothetical protein SAMN02910291_02948 [Desulfovibrio desulfuricans]SPD35197.1 Hypothetical protein DSVG11_1092 [Desulfovibrio sp. G11]